MSRAQAEEPQGLVENPKVAISVFDGSVRVSGTLELGARDLSPSRRGLSAITAGAGEALPGWRIPAESNEWTGMRSLAPDGLPLIGAVAGLGGLYVATAHATLGITLAPLGAELLSKLILERKRDPLLAAFDPARAASTGCGSKSTAAGMAGAAVDANRSCGQ